MKVFFLAIALFCLTSCFNNGKTLSALCETRGGKDCYLYGLYKLDRIDSFEPALPYLEKACLTGYALGCLDSGILYELSGDKAKSAEFFKKACSDKAVCHKAGLHKLSLFNTTAALELFRSNCLAGFAPSCVEEAKTLFGEGKKLEALSKLKGLCTTGELGACRELGQALEGEKRYSEAITAMEKSCSEKDLPACSDLGSLYEKTGRNDKAAENYMKYCRKNQYDFCQKLSELYLNNGKVFEGGAIFESLLAKEFISFEKLDPLDDKSPEAQFVNLACQKGINSACLLIKKTKTKLVQQISQMLR